VGHPKSQSLCAAVAEHHSALEADLARFYQVDLLDLWRGRLSWRKLAQLVRWLPRDAALYESMRLARPPQQLTPDPAAPRLTDPLAALQYGTPRHVADLLMGVLNLMESDFYRQSDPKSRGKFTPTLPPGYTTPVAEAMAAAADPAVLDAYFSAMPPPEPPSTD
jgi:hypothetical protein